MSELFKDCQICAKNDLNLIRLNILYGKAENYQSKEYFQEAYSKAKKINNKMIKLTLIELAEYFLINSKFDDFDKCVAEYQEIKDKDDKYDKNLYDLIKNAIERAKKLIIKGRKAPMIFNMKHKKLEKINKFEKNKEKINIYDINDEEDDSEESKN